jgi:hypothetical protein
MKMYKLINDLIDNDNINNYINNDINNDIKKKKENKKEKQVLDIIENFDGGIQKHKMRSIILLVMILLFAIIVFIE